MSEGTAPKVRYVAASEGEQHHVFVIHEDAPDWWRRVATFASADRADSYVDVEQMLVDEEMPPRADEHPPTPALAQREIKTRITVETLSRSTVERTDSPAFAPRIDVSALQPDDDEPPALPPEQPALPAPAAAPLAATVARSWADDEPELRRLFAEGKSDREIGRLLGRTHLAVQQRRSVLKLRRGEMNPAAPAARAAKREAPPTAAVPVAPPAATAPHDEAAERAVAALIRSGDKIIGPVVGLWHVNGRPHSRAELLARADRINVPAIAPVAPHRAEPAPRPPARTPFVPAVTRPAAPSRADELAQIEAAIAGGKMNLMPSA